MSRKKDSEFWSSAYLNTQTYNLIYNNLKQLAISRFKWDYLPTTVNEQYLETALYENGKVCYFNDEIIGNLCLKCTTSPPNDVYDVPINREVHASNNYNRKLNKSNSVLIYNNYSGIPTHPTLMMYALRLAEIRRTMDINVKAQKTPTLILSTEQQRLTMKNLYMQYDGNQPFIYGDKDMLGDNSAIRSLKTDAPYVCDDLQILYNDYWNEALTFLGIENANMDKKERLVSTEVNGNSGNIEQARFIELNSRRLACEEINRMFDTNISVGFRSDLDTLVNSSINKIVDLESEVKTNE